MENRPGTRKRLIWRSAIAGVALSMAGVGATASAQDEQVCPDFDTGKLGAGNATETTITAPEGQVIVAVCVKAGSAQQGDGPEITTFDPGVTEVTISHSTGKEISHYSVDYDDEPDDTTTTAASTTTTTTGGGGTTTTTMGGGTTSTTTVGGGGGTTTTIRLPETGPNDTAATTAAVAALLTAAGAGLLLARRRSA